MGDFAKSDLVREGGLYPQHAEAPCAGCGAPLHPDDRVYAIGEHIWHPRCWPSTAAAVPEREARA